MTNAWQAGVRAKGNGFEAVVRRADKAQPYILKDRHGFPLFFTHEHEAELAAARHLISLWNSEICFDITKASPHAISEQEKAFGAVNTRRGQTTVKRRRRKQKQVPTIQ